MATTSTPSTEIPTGLLAVVGAGDYAVEQVRSAIAVLPAVAAQFEARVSQVQADVQRRVDEFDPMALQAQAQEVPNKAAATLLQGVSKAQIKAEATYETLAERGAKLIDSIRNQRSSQILIDQASSTVARGKAAVTVARKATDDTVSAVRGTVTVGRHEAASTAETVTETTRAQTRTAAKRTATAAKKTTTAAKRARTTATKGATSTRSAVKGARTSARKSAAAAGTAAKDAAAKVGD